MTVAAVIMAVVAAAAADKLPQDFYPLDLFRVDFLFTNRLIKKQIPNFRRPYS